MRITNYGLITNEDSTNAELNTINDFKLLSATDFLTPEIADSLINDAQEICRIIGKIQITTKNS